MESRDWSSDVCSSDLKDIFEKAAADQMWQDRNRDAGKCSQHRLPEQDGEQCNQDSKPTGSGRFCKSGGSAPSRAGTPRRISEHRAPAEIVTGLHLSLIHIWKELGTSCRNLPQVHTIVRMLRMICEVVCPGVLLLGEVGPRPSRRKGKASTTSLSRPTTLLTTSPRPRKPALPC